MNNIVVSDDIKIENMIYEIRDKQVMLDSDLAKLYGCKNGTKSLNLAVKRNIERFPQDFYFQINKNEYDNLKFQIETSSWNMYGGVRKLPYVFTEQGVAMLATVLKTENASIVSVNIMRAFVVMKNIINTSLIEQKYFNELTIKNTEDIKLLQESFDKLNIKESNNHIFYEGQIYDAYSLLIDILSKAKKEIIIIDNYAGKELLDILKNIKTNIVVVSSNIDDTLKKKYEMQYKNVTFINNNKFHDRFIIIDKDILYTCGSSFKDLGKKCFYIGLIEDREILNNIISKLTNVQGCNL